MPQTVNQIDRVRRLHHRVGWWSLLVFLSLGIVLESLHGLKVAAYLDAANETRRLMWTLAHAHGTLLAVLHLVFGGTVAVVPHWSNSGRMVASRCLLAAGVLMPAGFFLGGVTIYGGDPGLGVLLVIPAGGFLLLAVLLTALATSKTPSADPVESNEPPSSSE